MGNANIMCGSLPQANRTTTPRSEVDSGAEDAGGKPQVTGLDDTAEIKPLPLTTSDQREEEFTDAPLQDLETIEESQAPPQALQPSAELCEQGLQDEMARQRSEEYSVAVRHSREAMREEYAEAIRLSRKAMKEDPGYGRGMPANRYGTHADLPAFEAGKHVPVLGLLNPMSGAMAGMDILAITRRTPYYQNRFFNIIDVVKGQRSGGLMDVFRIELNAAKEEAKAMGTRPRLISGGGDGTGSFAVFMLFLALKANQDRAEEGLADTGNGFIWTDAEMEESFPALCQLPLGSANDFGNILGWGQKYPGDGCSLCSDRSMAAAALFRWMAAAIDRASQVVNFDIWGIMPANGQERCNFKIAELTGRRGPCPNESIDGLRQLQLKEAGKPVPFFVMLYFSAGFGAYMTARFQINRRNTPLKNRMEYTRQAIGIIKEPPPPQMLLRLNGVEIDCEGKPYFPPRKDAGNLGRGYREVGFYNINWQAHLMHGADRASVGTRLMSKRPPVQFNDGLMDLYRWKFLSILKNPGLRVQTDKKKDLSLTFTGEKGKGVFFQWDGEARFAFSPTGEAFNIFIRRVLSVPVVLGPFVDPRLTGQTDNGREVKFEFAGEDSAEKEKVRRRVLQYVAGQLDTELIASREEILSAGLRHWDIPAEEQ